MCVYKCICSNKKDEHVLNLRGIEKEHEELKGKLEKEVMQIQDSDKKLSKTKYFILKINLRKGSRSGKLRKLNKQKREEISLWNEGFEECRLLCLLSF